MKYSLTVITIVVFIFIALSFKSKRGLFDFNLNKDTAPVEKLRENYPTLRQSIEIKRQQLYQRFKLAKTKTDSIALLNEASIYLRKTLLYQIYPTWYGTTWDFNGITEKPGEGYIACGYFVSTTLKHVGVNLNRYKVAQQYSHSIVNTLCSDVKVFTSCAKIMEHVKANPDAIYIVGLDNHVGYIAKEGDKVRFIHSSYVYPSHVLSEPASISPVLLSSKKYVIGNLTLNKRLLEDWLTGTAIVIKK